MVGASRAYFVSNSGFSIPKTSAKDDGRSSRCCAIILARILASAGLMPSNFDSTESRTLDRCRLASESISAASKNVFPVRA